MHQVGPLAHWLDQIELQPGPSRTFTWLAATGDPDERLPVQPARAPYVTGDLGAGSQYRSIVNKVWRHRRLEDLAPCRNCEVLPRTCAIDCPGHLPSPKLKRAIVGFHRDHRNVVVRN